MEVEVKQQEGYYLKAYVNDITDAGIDVVYEKGRKQEVVNIDRCRAVIAEGVQKQNFKAGDIVDAYAQIDKKEDICGWLKMKIRDIKNDFAVVDSVEEPYINDIIPVTQCRHLALPTQITSSTVKSCTIEIKDDLIDYFARGDDTFKVLQESIPNILVKLDREAEVLVIKSFSAAAIKKVGILKEVFLSNSRQKMALLQRQEEQKKMLSVDEPNNDEAFCIDFEVSTEFMGLAIGSQGANIQNARNLDGIKEVSLDESMRDQGYCKFKIYANNAEAAEQARNMLQFLQQHKMVPQGKVGQVIGKQGKTIQDIVDKSGVVRVQIGDENPEQGMVPFTFTGTREAISIAELMVEFQLKHINEMDEIRAEEDEIRRKLYMSRNSPFLHYNNNGHQPQYHRPQHQREQNNNMRRNNVGAAGNRPQQQDGGEQQRRIGGGFRASGGPRGPPQGRFNQQGGGERGAVNNRYGHVGAGGGGRMGPRRQYGPHQNQQNFRDQKQRNSNHDGKNQSQQDQSPQRAKRPESEDESSSNEGANVEAAVAKK